MLKYFSQRPEIDKCSPRGIQDMMMKLKSIKSAVTYFGSTIILMEDRICLPTTSRWPDSALLYG